ncbi:MAG: hypothetical protein IPH31_05410 [Lewinellaceae bacterium]|nr:hypothetical protein [Lewinellaceae bacterium]
MAYFTLSTWLRDYLYIPMGGNRDSSIGTWVVTGGLALTLAFHSFGLLEGEWWWLAIWAFGDGHCGQYPQCGEMKPSIFVHQFQPVATMFAGRIVACGAATQDSSSGGIARSCTGC